MVKERGKEVLKRTIFRGQVVGAERARKEVLKGTVYRCQMVRW